MKTKGQANAMVILLMVIIIAMVSISVVWGIIRNQQDTTAVTENLFTGINDTCVRLTDNCISPNTLSVINTTNATKDITTNFTECGDTSNIYGARGNIGHCGECERTLALNASYTEQACGRITGLTGTIIDYIPLLMAVLILVFVAGFAIK